MRTEKKEENVENGGKVEQGSREQGEPRRVRQSHVRKNEYGKGRI